MATKIAFEQLNKLDSLDKVLGLLQKGMTDIPDVCKWQEAHTPKQTGGGFTVKVSEKTGILVFGGFSANPKNTVNIYESAFYQWIAEINDQQSTLAKKLAEIKSKKLASQGKDDERFPRDGQPAANGKAVDAAIAAKQAEIEQLLAARK
jgi:hypothetical protein